MSDPRPLRNRRRGLLAALAAVLLTNVAVFAHVAWNRSGGEVASLALTDRELTLPYYDPALRGDADDTGIGLTFDMSARAPVGREKLGELGFDVGVDPDSKPAERHYRNVLPRDIWIVLELEGDAWAGWLEDREEDLAELRREVESGEFGSRQLREAEVLLAEQRVERSRLFAIDCGLDRKALRRRYDDPARYAVVPGTVRLSRIVGGKDEPARLNGHLSLSVTELQVPLRLRSEVESVTRTGKGLRDERATRIDRRGQNREEVEPVADPIAPVMRAEVAFGRLGEPWLKAVEALSVVAPASDSQTESAMRDRIDGERGGG